MQKDNYKLICELTWGAMPIAISKGSIPITREDNEASALFKETLKLYPELGSDDRVLFDVLDIKRL